MGSLTLDDQVCEYLNMISVNCHKQIHVQYRKFVGYVNIENLTEMCELAKG